mgnify:CR=1 FL=1
MSLKGIFIAIFFLTLTLQSIAQVIVKGTPHGVMLEHSSGSSFNYYYFCQNGALVKDTYYFDVSYFGTWSLNGDTIRLKYDKVSGFKKNKQIYPLVFISICVFDAIFCEYWLFY